MGARSTTAARLPSRARFGRWSAGRMSTCRSTSTYSTRGSNPALAAPTPEAGVWSSREAIAVIRGLGGIRLAAADVVEVAPAYDHAEVTAIAAANIVYEMLCLFSMVTA